jgi:hypothetical protein
MPAPHTPPPCPHCGHKPLPDTRHVWAEYARRVAAGEQQPSAPTHVTYTTTTQAEADE